jgi:signal transduction histidine kinase
MIELPQKDFRGKPITFEQFCDLSIIGMSGLSDSLMENSERPFIDGMVNYRLVADQLGLKYEPSWLEDFGHRLDNQAESIASHDSPPQGEPEDPYWVYLNSGFTRIAELLHEKYYAVTESHRPTYTEFRDHFLFELVGMVQDRISEDGEHANERNIPSYNLKRTADFLGLTYHPSWIERLEAEWLSAAYIVASDTHHSDNTLRYHLTDAGYEHAQNLSEQISSGDGLFFPEGKGQVFFSVDASHISRLGLELVAKQETAVAELVKNGYDADATQVDLIFSTSNPENTSLEIFDNGSGMTFEQLESGFMRISTPSKVTSPKSEIYGRQKAGRKGIGRFAAQRLGRRLILETATEQLPFGLRLEIDWDQFAANTNLSSIPNRISRIKKPFPKGTRLFIQRLRDSWSDAQIERSHRHIAELIQPFPLGAVAGTPSRDPGFKATFARAHNGDLRIVADDWSLYFRHALAEIEGSVDEHGHGSWRLTSERFSIDEGPHPIGPVRDTAYIPYRSLRNVHFRAYYYIDKETQRSIRSKVAEKLQTSGGIRLYRNGFRVLPYGERFDDWLKLNASNLLRKVLPPHSNRNFLGFVEIMDVDGTLFEETSSREGLLENEALIDLKDFVSSALKTAILPIADARDRRRTTTDTRQKLRSPRGQADDILSRLNVLQKSATEDPEYARALSMVVDTVRQSIIDIGESGEALLQELGMMRVLASLGLAIGEFTHEIRLSLETVNASASLLAAQIDDGSEAASQAQTLLSQIADLEGYITYFDSTVRNNVSREITALEIRDVVNSFISVVSRKIQRKELEIESIFEGYGLFVKPMHKSEWSSILINLFTNSLKAIRRAGTVGKIRIHCGRENGSVFLEFMDNGDGIPPENQARVFDAFYTTTAALGASQDDQTLAGMGLGLKVVKDIIDTVDGSIRLEPAPKGFATCFRIEVPEATDEEIPANAY